MLKSVTESGRLAEEKPAAAADGLTVFSDQNGNDVKSLVSGFFRNARPADYVAIQAYFSDNEQIGASLQEIRMLIRDRLRLATTVGYGPCYLHSTGQYHKGGPDKGLFLQLTAEDPEDVPLPGRPYTFSVLKRAQALGDLQALRKHGRRAIKIHMGKDILDGLGALKQLLQQVLM